MAKITATNTNSNSPVAVTETTLGASDTLTYDATKDQLLIIRNASGGAITPNIDGDGATGVFVPGIGDVDVSGGYTFASIADGDVVALKLRAKRGYMSGEVTITGGDDAVVVLLEV